jgi:outer membrane protein OmpA-like peptidoglycan-associated protein
MKKQRINKGVAGLLILMIGGFLTACTTTDDPIQKAIDRQKRAEAQTVKKQKEKPVRQQTIQVIQTPDRLRIVLYSDQCFEPSGHRHMRPLCVKQLDKTLDLLQSYGSGPIKVLAYTDDMYDANTALQIAQRQAVITTAFLWSRGIPSAQLQTIGRGRQDFVASNRDIRASVANRRVEIVREK